MQVEHRKIWCDACAGVRVEQLDFVDASQRVTNRLAAYAAALCQLGLSVQAVAKHLDLDPKTVKTIDKAALRVAFGQTDYAGLQRLSIDEIAVRKGHSYMTVVLDYDTGRVVWMGEGRQIETLDRRPSRAASLRAAAPNLPVRHPQPLQASDSHRQDRGGQQQDRSHQTRRLRLPRSGVLRPQGQTGTAGPGMKQLIGRRTLLLGLTAEGGNRTHTPFGGTGF